MYYILFKISALRLFVKYSLKFLKFQPRYSYKIYSHRKKRKKEKRIDIRTTKIINKNSVKDVNIVHRGVR